MAISNDRHRSIEGSPTEPWTAGESSAVLPSLPAICPYRPTGDGLSLHLHTPDERLHHRLHYPTPALGLPASLTSLDAVCLCCYVAPGLGSPRMANRQRPWSLNMVGSCRYSKNTTLSNHHLRLLCGPRQSPLAMACPPRPRARVKMAGMGHRRERALTGLFDVTVIPSSSPRQ